MNRNPEPAEGIDPGGCAVGGVLTPMMIARLQGESEAGVDDGTGSVVANVSEGATAWRDTHPFFARPKTFLGQRSHKPLICSRNVRNGVA